MIKQTKRLVGLMLLLGIAMMPVLAQQTGNLVATVTTQEGDTLPGVVVTLESPALQGKRQAVSNENGRVLFRLLPSGDYSVTAVMAGMQTQKQTGVKVVIGQPSKVKLPMVPSTSQEQLVVVSESVLELDTPTVVTVFDNDMVEKLPRSRGLESVALLAPGVSNHGNGISVNGAQSHESSYTLNGANIAGDNVYGGASDQYYIEDDIQETQVMTGNVSAEYGNFTGGVVNAVTKSGGNEFSGTIRTELTKDSWSSRDPLEQADGVTLDNTLNKTFTFTVNGPVIKDRLWFAVAGRYRKTKATDQTSRFYSYLTEGSGYEQQLAQNLTEAYGFEYGTPRGPLEFTTATESKRYSVKLTGTITEGHTLVASYLDDQVDQNNRNEFLAGDLTGLVELWQRPSTLATLNYRGIINDFLSVEGLYARRTLGINPNNQGDLVTGTTVRLVDQAGGRINAPFGGPEEERRDSDNYGLKVSYFLDTASVGSHDLVVGAEKLLEKKNSNNHQSPSGLQFWNTLTRFDDNGNPVPIFAGVNDLWQVRNNAGDPLFGSYGEARSWAGIIVFYPIVNPSQGSEFNSDSLYVNDSWYLNDKWSFNLGLRYDSNDTKAEDGQELSSDSAISPRITANYDIFGDGKHQFTAGYNEYVGRLFESAQGGSTAGSPAIFAYRYDGPYTETIEGVLDWMESAFPGGVNGLYDYGNQGANPHLIFASYSADTSYDSLDTVVQEGGLRSQSVEEMTLSYKIRLNQNKGFVRANYIDRDYVDLLSQRIDSTTGQNNTGSDRTVLYNDNDIYQRTYEAFQVSGEYNFNPNLTMGGNFTYADAEGNYTGEAGGRGATSVGSLSTYPEYSHPNRAPLARIGAPEIESRLWTSYTLNTSFGEFNFSGLHTWISGDEYALIGSLNIDGRETEFGFPDPNDLGYYATPPTSVTYYFTDPDAFQYPDYHSTDVQLNYELSLMNKASLFVQFRMTNVLNNDREDNVRTGINTTGYETFNVFTETPVEGVHYQRDNNFGEITRYQTARAYRFDVGFRF